MSKRFSERILEYLRRPDYQPMKPGKLARAIGIAEAEHGDFHDAVDALRRVGRVVLGTNNALTLPYPPGHLVGTYRANPRGFGFVVPDEPTAHGDLYISAGQALDAVTGDRVLCRVLSRGKRGGKTLMGGRIVEVIERGESKFVGQLGKDGATWYVRPDGNTLHAPILIGDANAKNAKPGDQVVVEITQYPAEGVPARGVIVERLGQHGRPGVDLLGVVRQYHLPDAFPEEGLSEARQAVRAFAAEKIADDREVLDHLTIITIDPDDARDFDDAISLEKLSAGAARGSKQAGRTKKRPKRGPGQAAWELGVHIADVSAFVPIGSALDGEAEKRGTSVYFPGRVIPMLPEVLSNGVCSLQEDEPRLCKSAFIRYDAEGKVVSARFANTVIRSTKRLTYGQATSILSGKRGRLRKEVVDLVGRLDRLARLIRKRRMNAGMIVLNLPAVDLVLDDAGRVVDARPEDTSFSHTIIEMFMVEANEAAARLLASLKLPFLRRIHPDPDDESLQAIARFSHLCGIEPPRKMGPHDLQRLLGELREHPSGYAVNLAVLRSMQMAEYSPKDVGHFALASRSYAHFTSPIRRYPDLMIHRLLDLHLRGRIGRHGKGRSRGLPGLIGEERLHERGRQMSYLSRRAESAERELKTIKVLTLLERRLGDEFDGVVTGVTNFGMFIQHPKYLIDGLLRLEDLGDDWWEVDVKAGSVIGERSRRSFNLGGVVRVRIAEVNVSSRQLNLSLGERSRSGGGRRAKVKRPGPQRRGSTKKASSPGGGSSKQRGRGRTAKPPAGKSSGRKRAGTKPGRGRRRK